VLQSISEKYGADWQIDELKINFVDKIEAKGILLKDQALKTMLSADHITIDIGLFSLFNKEISLDDIKIENGNLNLYELPDGKMNYSFVLPDADNNALAKDTTSSSWSFGLRTINLNQFDLNYKTKDLEVTLKQDELYAVFDKIDFENQVVLLNHIRSQNSYTYFASKNETEKSSSAVLPDLGWTIKIDDLEMQHQLIVLNDEQDLKISALGITAKNIDYQADSLMIDITKLEGNYNDELIIEGGSAQLAIHQDKVDGNQIELRTKTDKIFADQLNIGIASKSYDIKNLSSDLSYDLLKMLEPYITDIQLIKGRPLRGEVKSLHFDPQKIDIKNIDFQYGAALNLKGSVYLNSPKGDFENPQELRLNIDMLKSDIQQVDRILKTYSLPDSLRGYRNLTVSGLANGNLQLLNLKNFSLKLDDVVNAKVDGSITNINRTDDLSYNLQFKEFSANTLQLPYTSIDKIDIHALGQVNYIGNLSGDKNTVKLNGILESAIGNAGADIVLGIKDGLDSLTYDGDLSLTQFDLGVLLKDESLGKVTLNTTINGKGTTLKTGNSSLKGVIKDFQYKGYTYNIITLDARIKDSQIVGTIDVDDPNAHLQYDGTLILGMENSTFNFAMNIDTINLHTLNLYQDEISLSGEIESNFNLPLTADQKNEIIITELNLSDTTNHFYEDSITLSAVKKADSTFLLIDSDLMKLHMDGVYRVADLPASINDMVKTYIDTDTIIAHTNITSRNIHLYGQINTLTPFKILFVDYMLQSKPLSLDIKVDFEENSLQGRIEVDSFYYDDFFSEKLLLTAENDGKVIDVNVSGERNIYAGTPVYELNFANKISNSNIESVLSTIDKNNNTMVKLATQTQYKPEQILVTFQDSFILNNKNWEVTSDNLFKIENNCITISNFELTIDQERIKINSNSNNPNDLSILFENFKIEEFTDLLMTNGSTASGIINGNIDIKDLCTAPYYIANMAVEDIAYDSTFVGTLKITGDSDRGNSIIHTEIMLSGPNNKVVGEADYNTSTRGIDANVRFDSLQFILLDPFLIDILKDSEGYLSGDIKVGGSIDEPELLGSAKLHNTITTIVANNTEYSFDDHVINFDNGSIDLGELQITDEEGNTASISGKIYHTSLQDMDIDLRIDTKKFIFLNTTIKENPVFNGKVILQAQGNIKGPPSLLDINMSAKSLEGTAIYISPYSAESYLKEDFITYGKPQDFEDLTDEYLLKLSKKYPFNMNLLLDVTDETQLTMVVDPINGDKVVGQGSANLDIKLDPYGTQEFYGVYTVKEGTYNFSYGAFIAKDFEIKEGGSITFNGDMLNAEVDIDAIHNVYTTTYELIKDEATLDANELNNAKSRTNVEVFLTLRGALSNIEILLDIQIPELASSSLVSPVERKLLELRDDPSELNNQVFGLLLFNSFLVSQSSNTGIGSIGSSLALNSISELVSNQLNNFAQNFIKGFDVSIDVNSYDSEYVNDGAGGNVTEVGLQVSKQLFNDRLSVSATGNVDIEQNDQQGYSSVVGDFVIEYKLTESGRYRIRVFSKTDYDRLLNENNNKNGVSLFFKKSFGSKRK